MRAAVGWLGRKHYAPPEGRREGLLKAGAAGAGGCRHIVLDSSFAGTNLSLTLKILPFS